MLNTNGFKVSMERDFKRFRIKKISSYEADQVYRFCFVNYMSFYQTFYTIVNRGSRSELLIQIYNVHDNFESPKIHHQEVLVLTDQQWKRFILVIQKECFWTMRTAEKTVEVLDGGTEWLEGYDRKADNCHHVSFHFVVRQSAQSNDLDPIIKEMIKNVPSLEKFYR